MTLERVLKQVREVFYEELELLTPAPTKQDIRLAFERSLVTGISRCIEEAEHRAPRS
jgi:hypothetical protein